MKLLIERNKSIDDKFIGWIINIVRTNIASTTDLRKLKKLETYFNDVVISDQDDVSEINFSRVLIGILNNLVYSKSKDYYHITVNPKRFLPSTHISLYDVAMYINYGNQEVAGYPIFTTVFNEVSNNIDSYYKWYSRERGGI